METSRKLKRVAAGTRVTAGTCHTCTWHVLKSSTSTAVVYAIVTQSTTEYFLHESEIGVIKIRTYKKLKMNKSLKILWFGD